MRIQRALLLLSCVASGGAADGFPDPSSAAARVGSGTGLTATYFDNPTLSGKPVLTRTEAPVDGTWGSGSPDPAAHPGNASARWLGWIQPTVTGTYAIGTYTADGVRVWIGNQLVIDDWTAHGPAHDAGAIALEAWKRYPVRMEAFAATGDAGIELRWTPPGGSASPIAAAQLYPFTGISIAAPSGSLVSPASIEGMAAKSGKPVAVAVDGSSRPTTWLGENAFCFDAPLRSDGAATSISASGPGTCAGLTTWIPLTVDGRTTSTDVYRVRSGDSLLLATAGSHFRIVGKSPSTLPVTGGVPQPVAFTAPGSYTVTAMAGRSTPLGAITVEVISLAISADLVGTVIACEVGYTRSFDVPVATAALKDRVAFSSSSANLCVTTGPTTGTGRTLSVTPATREYLAVAARVGANGPIIAAAQVQGYTVNRGQLLHASIVGKDAAGNTLSQNEIIIEPALTDLRLSLSMFAHASTFLGGKTSFKVRTNGTASSIGEKGFATARNLGTGETYAWFVYTIVSPPGETQFSHAMEIDQLFGE